MAYFRVSLLLGLMATLCSSPAAGRDTDARRSGAQPGAAVLAAGPDEQRVRERLDKANADLAGAQDDRARFFALPDAALWNAHAGDRDKASAYAHEILALAERFDTHWNRGNALHKAHLALGLLALGQDDVAAARNELLAAGRVPPSPQLSSFGPNMLLAAALVNRGERDAVIEYLGLCAGFWKLGRETVSRWSTQIGAGEPVDFGANLMY